MTLDDLERPKRHSCRNKQNLQSPSEKIKEDNTTVTLLHIVSRSMLQRSTLQDILNAKINQRGH